MLRLLRFSLSVLMAAVPAVAAGQSRGAPAEGLRDATPRCFAFTNATVHVTPDRILSNGTLLVRDGKVVAVGSDLEPPADAVVFPLSGRTIYPAFIDAYSELSTGPLTSSPAAGGYWNPRAAPQIRASAFWQVDEEAHRKLRRQGIALRLIAPRGAILRGRSALITTGDATHAAVVKDPVALHVQIEPLERSYREGFPNSIMGAVAFVRQTLCDALWHSQARAASAQDLTSPPPSSSLALQTLAPYVHGEALVIVDVEDELAFLRAANLIREFKLKALIRGSGSEYRRLAAIRETGHAVIVPLSFPRAPVVDSVETSLDATLEELLHWDLAPENTARLVSAKVPIALTTHGLSQPEDFLPALRRAVRRGLMPSDALRALTTAPAAMFGVADRLGTLEPGKAANFLVTDGDLFAAKTRIVETWIDGRRYQNQEPGDEQSTDVLQPMSSDNDATKPGEPCRALFDVSFPLGAYGRATSAPPQTTVLFREATVWTCGSPGQLSRADVLIRDGKILAVGDSLAAHGAQVIDCRGKHLTPGLIDCHSHIAITGGITDSGKTSTAELRIADVINSDDPDIYRQLAGGTTCVHLLPGSDNTLAGQSQVVKLRWGALPEEMIIAAAPPGLKLALGENVKQSNWGDDFRLRYPQTRMGVEQLLLDRLQAARHYLRSQADAASRPFRIDLELHALAEVLKGSRRLHCHAYRQDEILAYVRLCSALGIRPGTLHHASEGYKLADLLLGQQAGVSSFSDWWAYKFEVYEAIPHNAAMLHGAGVQVSINSDDPEMARRLNMEAAKAIKYGGLSPEEALKLVTIAPARQLGMDHLLGTIEPGKDADLVVWSGPPLSALSRCEQAWVDGRLYFDVAMDQGLRTEADHRRAALIQRVLQYNHAQETVDQAAKRE